MVQKNKYFKAMCCDAIQYVFENLDLPIWFLDDAEAKMRELIKQGIGNFFIEREEQIEKYFEIE